ncbi:unnamed protein product, partial [Rotaria magnacalcarata]
RPQRGNFWLMLIRSFRSIWRWRVRLFQVVPVMNIRGSVDFNRLVPSGVCTLFEYFSKPEYGIHQMNPK